jgi:hypothetical protein
MLIMIDHEYEQLRHGYNFHIHSKSNISLEEKKKTIFILPMIEFDYDRYEFHLVMIPILIFLINEN